MDLPRPCWVSSVAELNGNVYVTPLQSEGGLPYPFKYDLVKNQSALPCVQFILVSIPNLNQLLAIAIGGLSDPGFVIPDDKVFIYGKVRSEPLLILLCSVLVTNPQLLIINCCWRCDKK